MVRQVIMHEIVADDSIHFLSDGKTSEPFRLPEPHSGHFRFDLQGALAFYSYVAIWLLGILLLPNQLWHKETFNAVVLIGMIGTWRYAWWMANLSRAGIYSRFYYPALRKKADRVWQTGRRSEHVHFLMTTFYEEARTTHIFLDALLRELKRDGLRGTLWVGFGAKHDEEVIRQWTGRQKNPPLDIVMVRQNQPGKRMAIGIILRALSRHGVGKDDIAYLMDGDSILGEGVLQKTISIFEAEPDVGAMTTNEEAVVMGPKWVEKWLIMRFAQRRMWMQSHALSKRVLTLTGRMSAYRAHLIVDKEFIRTVEADELRHWLWGNFRFLSGDDKSTWYTLLKRRINMLYIPDAMVYTIEYIEGNGVRRMVENLMRWSGNMLRNGMRAIMLGPKTVSPFIWWCLIDQRIAIWTVLIGFTTSMAVSLFIDHSFIFTYILWIMFTRMVMSMALFCFSDRIRISYPLFLYINQLFSAFVKVYILFRLPRQRWSNRQGQTGGGDAMNSRSKRLIAMYINLLYIFLMLFCVCLVTGILQWPKYYQLIF